MNMEHFDYGNMYAYESYNELKIEWMYKGAFIIFALPQFVRHYEEIQDIILYFTPSTSCNNMTLDIGCVDNGAIINKTDIMSLYANNLIPGVIPHATLAQGTYTADTEYSVSILEQVKWVMNRPDFNGERFCVIIVEDDQFDWENDSNELTFYEATTEKGPRIKITTYGDA